MNFRRHIDNFDFKSVVKAKSILAKRVERKKYVFTRRDFTLLRPLNGKVFDYNSYNMNQFYDSLKMTHTT